MRMTAAYRRSYRLNRLAWFEDWRPSGAQSTFSQYEPGALLQWLCDDDSTINIVISISMIRLLGRIAVLHT